MTLRKSFNYCHNCAKDNRTCGAFDVYGEKCPMWEKRTPTNADHIRSMTDEELAKYLEGVCAFDCHLCSEHCRLDNNPLLRGEVCDEKCVEHCLEWLQQPWEVE